MNNLSARFNDALNPIVVKELRQAVHSRFVVALLLVLLTVQLTAVALYLLFTRLTALDLDAGRAVFMILLGILLGACLIFVPSYTAVRLLAERSDTNVDLLFITTIKPRSIIAGKLTAATILTAWIFSACLPFLTFTYFLRGIDLPSIFAALALSFIVILGCSQLAVFVACLPVNRVFKVLFGLALLGVFLAAFVATMGGAESLTRAGVGDTLNRWDFWGPALAVVAIAAALIGLLFVLSVALIMPLAANRALPVRVFITAAWLLTGATAGICSYFWKFQAPVIVWQVLSGCVFAVALLAAVSERDRLGRRVLRAVPPAGGRRWAAFPFFSGAASGLAWAGGMTVLTLGAAWLWRRRFSTFAELNDLIQCVKFMGGLSLFVYCYALSAAWLRRHLLRAVDTELTWLIGLILMLLGSIVPFLLGYLLFFNDSWRVEDVGAWLIGNPFAYGNKAHRVLYTQVGGVWALLATALNLHWFIERVRGFQPAGKAEAAETIGLGLS